MGGKKIFTTEMIDAIAKVYPVQNNQEIASCFGVSPWQIKALASRMNWKKEIKFYKTTWEERDLDFLKANYKTSTFREIGICLGKSRSTIKSKVYDLGLKLSEEDLTPERRNIFQKGLVPHNKGKKMNPETYEKCKGTFFQKGQVCVNKKPIGATRITDGYILIKVAEPNVWDLLHRIVYEKCYGSIPKKHNVNFKDGNRMNCQPENLFCITKQEQMLNNSLQNLPKELIEIILLKAKITRKINQRLKTKN